MGIILSRFRKKKTTIEILESLDSQIKEIERYGHTTEQRHKRIVGTLILYSVILYIISAFIFYFCFFPASLYDQIFYIIPLLIFPILILLTKKMVTWYYKRKISENQEKLSTMQFEKKKILDEVTETETYKKAKEILLKFAPDQLKMTPSSYRVPQPTETPQRSISPQNLTPSSNLGELRKRVLTSQKPVLNVQRATPSNTGLAPIGISPIQTTPIGFQGGIRPAIPVMGYRSPLPRPILPRERNYLERLVDYIVGDGPANRYALICRQCFSHNGMSLKEEFEYFGFKCCYCNTWNPARKQKCAAPRLELDATIESPMQLNTSNESEEQTSSSPSNDNEANAKPTQNEPSSPSDTDSDIEVVERPTESEDTEQTAEDSKKEDVAEEPNDGVEKMDIDESAS
ncbi:zinc-ribbon metal-binding protein lunapark isoform X2 [Lasioglossum baleicum]|uniref:zinc-ribbon metal-binding protein lunapark isoform X2 n=1 Tax=Lasioglossum baleicum TaxID=434251 RepID=UPI003FCDDC08